MSETKVDGDGSAKNVISSWITSKVRKQATRREFLKVAGVGGLGAASLYMLGCVVDDGGAGPAPTSPTGEKYVISLDAKGLVIHQPTRCVGCRRCELACTEYNEGKSHPAIARVNIRRNWNYGVEGARLGAFRGDGRWGNHRIVGETCRQCAHPVPCRTACPYSAIEVQDPVNARVVNQDLCQGCRICQRACPWGMTTFDEETQTAHKCHLCAGEPECVQTCPTGALQYIPREDKTRDVPVRFAIPASIPQPDWIKDSCNECH